MLFIPFENTIIVSTEDFYMKSLFNKYIWLQFILSVLLLFAGALIIAFAIKDGEEGTILIKGLNIIVAIILYLFGLFAIVASFAFEPNKVITNGIIYADGNLFGGLSEKMDPTHQLIEGLGMVKIFDIVKVNASINLNKSLKLLLFQKFVYCI